MIDSAKICALGILIAIICVFIRQYKGEFIVPTRIAGLLIIMSIAVVLFIPVYEYLKNIFSASMPTEYMKIIVKALGIAFISQIASSICKDCGENNIAMGIETVCKIEMLILTIPLIDTVIQTSKELMLW